MTRHLLTILLLSIIFSTAATCNLSAQQATNADAQFVAPKKTKHHAEKKIEVEPPIKLNGILVKSYRDKKPLEAINIFAPASEDESENAVQEDSQDIGRHQNVDIGRPQGFILFGIQW